MNTSIDFFNTQKCFRTLLQAMSHPGRALAMNGSGSKESGGVLLMVASTLMDHEVSFWMEKDGPVQPQELAGFTGSMPLHVEQADYLIIHGSDSGDAMERAKKGTPEYPDLGATLIYFLDPVEESEKDVKSIGLKGPGIPESQERSPELNNIPSKEWRKIKKANSEFPLGVDCIFLTQDGRIMAVPRSTLISIDPG